MTKPELITAMVEKTGLSKKDNELALQAFQDVVTEELVKGGKVALIGFGIFEVTERKPRVGRNPKSGEEIPIPASKAPKFKAGKQLKDAIKNT